MGSEEIQVSVKAKERAQVDLETRADAILDRDAILIKELGTHAAKLRDCYEELLRPRNDPAYLKTLEASEEDRNYLANQIAAVHLNPDAGRNWISVVLANPRAKSIALEVVRRMSKHFEAEAFHHEDQKDPTRLADRTQKQPAKHAFGREKRSLR